MIKVASIKQVRQIEAAADASGVSYSTLMENAGRATADRALAYLSALETPHVVILVGPGNNGGDGLVAGRFIAEDSKAQVQFYCLKKREISDPNFKRIVETELAITYAENDKNQQIIRNMINHADLIIDALFGVGIRLPLRDDAANLLCSINALLSVSRKPTPISTSINPTIPGQVQQSPRPYIIAVDCPTGLDCDSGELDPNAIRADETISFLAAKPGLFTFPGAEFVGQLSIATIGVDDSLPELQEITTIVVDSEAVRSHLPERPTNSHKGTFGKALIVAGSVNYTGAAGLATEAAYRTGTGLVTVAAPGPVITALSTKLAEPTWLFLSHDMGVISDQAVKVILKEIDKYNALLLGPGWGRERTTRDFLTNLLSQSTEILSHNRPQIGFLTDATAPPIDQKESSNTILPPLIIDADGLNLLSEIDEWWKLLPKETILTPHPAEMARLANTKTNEVQTNRWQLVKEKAVEWEVILVLKGAYTLIADPNGKTAVLPFNTDALATAGTGDVLAGAITGFLAQGLSPFDAAIIGGYLHGLAGQLLAETGNSRSVIASDVSKKLADAILMVEKANL